ncbi:MAG TPA: Kdo hydroxylase family protein, partial [Methylophilaceae bacterium]|nr:Kdo hydroxylase family protein [Methylophilaceae bacterium]
MESFLALIQPLLSLDIELWQPVVQSAVSENLAMALENGKVLALPNLPFALSAREQTFLSPSWLSGKRKNISLEGEQVGGAAGSADEMAALAAMIRRYREQAISLVTCMFPGYTSQLKPARTSFRPGLVQGNPSSWRKDDSRLHVDAFPSRPNRGERILRVFTNVNPHGVPRVWRVGEPFEAAARRFL